MDDLALRAAIEQIERGTAAYRARRRWRLNQTRPSRSGGDGTNRYHEEDVPQKARQLWESRPDLQTDFQGRAISAVDEGYDGRSGDLSELIARAANEGKIVDLESGEYEMHSCVTTGAAGPNKEAVQDTDLVGVVGDGSGDATIYYRGTALERLFNIDDVSTGVFGGLTVDIDGTAPNGLDSDVCILTGNFTHRFWGDDIRLRGKRNRFQDTSDTGQDDGDIGHRYTWLVQMTDDGSGSEPRGLVNNLRLPDGDKLPSADDPHGFGGSIGVATDETHTGFIAYRNCHVEGFIDNGYYMAYELEGNPDHPGEAVLWDCYGADVRGGAMRIGQNDTIVGGLAAVHDPPGGRNGKALEVQNGTAVSVVGLHVEATNYGGTAIQVRKNTRDLTLDRVTLRTADDPQKPVRLSSKADGPDVSITIEDCFWWDAYDSRSQPVVEIYNAAVEATNWHVLAEAYDDVVQSEDRLTVNGGTYGPGTYSPETLDMEDPRQRVKEARQNR